MPSLTNGPAYWRSLEHLAETEEFREWMHREFPAGASELLDGDRRSFLKVMGASMALAGLGLTGCRRWPVEQIMPYASRPEGRDPGAAVQFATSMEIGGVATGLLARSYDGRPIKIEGNPEHPGSLGAASSFAQASVLGLYDPDRSRGCRRDGKAASWEEFAAWAAADARPGSGMAILCEATSSPSVANLRRRLTQAGVSWHEYEPLANDGAIEGSRKAFGAAWRPILHLDRAEVVVDFEADVLGRHGDALRHQRTWGATRRPERGRLSRLWSVESDFSTTGAVADERLALPPQAVAAAAAYLAGKVAPQQAAATAAFAEMLDAGTRESLDAAASDLLANRGQGVIVAGEHLPAEVHWLVHLANAALGNAGATIVYVETPDARPHVASLAALVERMNSGSVTTLVIVGGNPVYDAPADLGFAAALAKVPNRVHLSDYRDETSAACTWHLNRAHYLESWGDARAWDGTWTLQQPLIRPLFGGHTPAETLATIAGVQPADGMTLVRDAFDATVGGRDEKIWRRALHDGFLAGSAWSVGTPRAGASGLDAALASLQERTAAAGTGWALRFTASPTIHDGRYANNGWLQELPDPLTKLTWDNAVLINPAEAATLGVREGDLVTVTAGGRSVEAPVMRLPGLPARTAVLHLGGDRRIVASDDAEARVATDAGFDFGALRTAAGMGHLGGATIARASGTYPLATTQDHHTIDVETTGGKGVMDRLPSIFREADWNEYEKHPEFAAHRTHVVHRLSLWEESNLDGAEHRWAMSIDLNACNGCSACVVACQAENNIPVVGKDQVLRGRELHWLRIDRYFAFDGEAGHYDTSRVRSVALQPIPCMQCENAPCEQVCPVAATVHDEDGLNSMVYNRCIGTRYCSNNCPYKVRRFNYFDYHRRGPKRDSGLLHVDPSYYTRRQATPDELETLRFNPEVSVRMRGVMEKCTYCVQRITDARIKAKNERAGLPAEEKKQLPGDRVPIPDGTIQPACAQTCAAQAIVFGDLADPESRVSRLHRNGRSYQVLEELNVKARTRYLARVRNPRGGGSEGHDAHGAGHGHDGESGRHEDNHAEASH